MYLLWCVKWGEMESMNIKNNHVNIYNHVNIIYVTSNVGVRSTVVERATYMRVYAGSSPTSADHRKELI